MVEVKNGKKILTTPISAEDLEGIHVGDIVYLNGSDRFRMTNLRWSPLDRQRA